MHLFRLKTPSVTKLLTQTELIQSPAISDGYVYLHTVADIHWLSVRVDISSFKRKGLTYVEKTLVELKDVL